MIICKTPTCEYNILFVSQEILSGIIPRLLIDQLAMIRSYWRIQL